MSLWSACLAITIAFPSAVGDRIVLRTGETLEGTILDEQDSFYVIKEAYGVRIIQKADVERVERQDPTGVRYRRKLAEIDPADAEAHFRLGLWCAEVGLPLEARDEFLKTIRISPDHADARRLLGYKGGPGAWYNPLLGEKPPKREPAAGPAPIAEIPEETVAAPSPIPSPIPSPSSGPTPRRPASEPIEPEPPEAAGPEAAATADWVRLIVTERVLSEKPEASNLRARVVNLLRHGSQPSFRVRPPDDNSPCRWRIEVDVTSVSAGDVTFMGLSLSSRCEARATVRVVDEKTNKVEAELPPIREDYSYRDLKACAQYALWKAEDTLLDAIRRHGFFRVKGASALDAARN